MIKEEGMRQKMEDAWKNFESSGKIMDYLNYSSLKRQADREHSDVYGLEKGMDSYGTKHCSDGDGFKCNAHWGV